ncbi:hypothetical protein BT69DRAFT_1350638 [Atractiella rhizophila]|nr:hypothetical protein BT69DRAFT_1350638 [Atractiella rhizophila]
MQPPSASTSASTAEYLETLTVSFEWRISNLKQLFESSNGPNKSKCLKSALFGENKWQIFFYPNSGHEQYCSLYLSCEPTLEERERGLRASALEGPLVTGSGIGAAGGAGSGASGAVASGGMGQWEREGVFKFTFETRSADKKVLFKAMEANDHAFNYEARNWGWAQFWQRNQAYFNNTQAKQADAFVIVCTIVYSPTPPAPPPLLLKRLIPTDLVEAYASLFDDPLYGDVCFRIRYEGGGLLGSGVGKKGGRREREMERERVEKRIYASKKVLSARSEYFSTMFNSGFVLHHIDSFCSTDVKGWSIDTEHRFYESSQEQTTSADVSAASTPRRSTAKTLSLTFSNPQVKRSSTSSRSLLDTSDSSDSEREGVYDVEELLEEEDYDEDESDFDLSEIEEGLGYGAVGTGLSALGMSGLGELGSEVESEMAEDESMEERGGTDGDVGMVVDGRSSLGLGLPGNITEMPSTGLEESEMEIVPSPSQPPSIGGTDSRPPLPSATPSIKRETSSAYSSPPQKKKKKRSSPHHRRRTTVIITDASYGTFRALLHYLYTDSILFAPLASTYYCARDTARGKNVPFPYASRKDFVRASIPKLSTSTSGGGRQMVPCSSKAIYRLADKLGLLELKKLARDHIVKSLSAQTIPYEVFGSFSRSFEDIRKVEMEVLLEKWNEVRGGEAMKRVFRLLRSGRFPGFEEVWIALLSNLEYKPKEESRAEEDDVVA